MPRRKKKDYEYSLAELIRIAKSYPDFDSPAFQCYTKDWLSNNNVELMTPEEVGGYFFLLLKSWGEPDCGLPANDVILARWSRLYDRWQDCKKSILNRFHLVGERWYNKRLLIERKKQVLSRFQKSEAGKESGKVRKYKRLEKGTHVEQVLNTRGTGEEHTARAKEEEKEDFNSSTSNVPVTIDLPEMKAKVKN
jgi:uncharacterized protein YdaU (DUF1376 family)